MSFPGRPVSAGLCSPCDDAAFVRPRFFAGQLLTEDDLEAMNAYVVGKNRLHNARLFGDGVVCGFEVVCGPCGGATVVVRPGHALDCCGNDLVLGCERELDIGAMIAALREQLRPGHGCADPCAGTRRDQEPCEEPGEGGETPGGEQPQPPPPPPTELSAYQAGKGRRAPDEYCLYVRYDERQTEPTAPYPVGDDCGTGPCEATRIVEGVTFELRCRPRDRETEDVLSRVVALLEQLSPDGRSSKELAFLAYTERTARPALARLDAGRLEVTDEERSTWQAWIDRLGPGRQARDEEPRAELMSRFAIEVGGVSLRAFWQGGGEKKAQDGLPDPELTAKLLEAAAAEIGDEPPEGEASLVTAGRAAIELYQSLRPSQKRRGAGLDDLTPAQQLYLYGWAHAASVHRRLARGVREVQRATMRAIDHAGSQTDCLARDTAANVPIFATDITDVAIEDVRMAVRSAGVMSRLTHGFLRDQACLALLPPCEPCDDPAVLLACVKVVGCNVVEICNLERRMVWSPTALRYWLPPLTWLGVAIEEVCCGGKLADVADVVHRQVDRRVAALEVLARAPGVGTFAQVASRFHARAPAPRVLAGSLAPLVALGGAASPVAPTTAPAEPMVTRAELEAIVAGLKAEIAQLQSHAPGKGGKGGKGREVE